jgi:23S rRNA (uracil1939-C5)-methyltransferase
VTLAASVDLTIERFAKSGEGVAHLDGRAVFIEGAITGEQVRVLVIERKVLRGELLEVLKPTPSRRKPPCDLAGRCGGCTWLHLDEPAQRLAKEQIVVSTLEHVGKLSSAEYSLLPMWKSPNVLAYRRRAALEVTSQGIGFHSRRSHDIVQVNACPAMVPELSQVISRLPALKGIKQVRLIADQGLGCSLHFEGQVRTKHQTLAKQLLSIFDCVTLVPSGGQVSVSGKSKPRADHFAQANQEVNDALVAAASIALGEEGAGLELFAGSGNFTTHLKGPLTAVESAATSMTFPHVRWIQGDVGKVVKGLIGEGAGFERLLLDPPRDGASGIGRWARALKTRRVVYVSCDPASLSRDAAELKEQGYAPKTVQLFDMFPQTHHIETLMTFERV